MKRTRLSSFGLSLPLILSSLACGGSDGSPIGVNNVSPRGSIGGLVVDAATMQALEGVMVSAIGGGKIYPESPTLTDGGGYFGIDGVPAGHLILRLSKDGYNPVTETIMLPNAAGDFPLANATLSLGPIGLLPTAAAEHGLRVLLVNPDGTPPNGIPAFLRTNVGWVNFATGKPVPEGFMVLETRCDSTGLLRFEGIPDYQRLAGLGFSSEVIITIPPVDANNDGVSEFLGKDVPLNVTKLGGAIPTIVLSSTVAGLSIIVSNIDALMGKDGNRVLPDVAGPLLVGFNWPLADHLTQVLVYDEGGKLLPDPPIKTVVNNLLSVGFSKLAAGAEYNVVIHAVALAEGTQLPGEFATPLFTPSPANSKVTVKALQRDAKVTSRIHVTFSEPIGTGVASKSVVGPLFYDHDFNLSGSVGDYPGERGSASSPFTLTIAEPNPPGKAPLSGLSSHWTFDIPTDQLNAPIVPSGRAIDFLFSAANATVERGDGTIVADIVGPKIP